MDCALRLNTLLAAGGPPRPALLLQLLVLPLLCIGCAAAASLESSPPPDCGTFDARLHKLSAEHTESEGTVMKESARGAAGSDAIDRPKGGRRDNSTTCVFFRRGWCRSSDVRCLLVFCGTLGAACVGA